jgi:hypothetical protein
MTKTEYTRRRRADLKTLGLCQNCAENAPQEGRTLCTDCLIARRNRAREHYHRPQPAQTGHTAKIERLMGLSKKVR